MFTRMTLCLAACLAWSSLPAAAAEKTAVAAKTPATKEKAGDAGKPADAKDAAGLTADRIVDRANYMAYYQGRDGKAEVKMKIIDKDGRTRTRTFVILRRDEQPAQGKDGDFTGEQRFYVYFKRPADWNKTVFRVHKHLDRDDDRWLYLPGLDLVKRIAATDKRTSFVGSHFFYEDVSGRNVNDDTHELVRTTKTAYVIKNVPKRPENVEFSYYLVYVHKATFLPYAFEFFDKQGKKYRTGRALATKRIQGYLTETKAEMRDLRTGGRTVVEYGKIKYDVNLPARIFSEQYLRNAPRRYLR